MADYDVCENCRKYDVMFGAEDCGKCKENGEIVYCDDPSCECFESCGNRSRSKKDRKKDKPRHHKKMNLDDE